jgi:hypothetical protein
LLANANTTKPLRRRIGSVVELTFNKSIQPWWRLRKTGVVYEITFDLLYAGLGMNAIHADKVGAGKNIEIPDVLMNNATAVAHIPDIVPEASTGRHYPTQPHRSTVSNQPYNTFSPHMTFLQLGET